MSEPVQAVTRVNDESRRPPLIIRVPPPERLRTPTAVKWIVVALLVALGIPTIPLLFVFPGEWAVVVAMLLGIIATFGLFIWALRKRSARSAAQRRQFLARWPDWAEDPVAVALGEKWRRGTQPPVVEAVLKAIHEAPVSKPPRSRVVCVGVVEVPEVGDLRFEPEIITPTRFMGKRLWVVPIALALFGLWLAQVLHVLPGIGKIPIGSFGYFLFMGFAVGGAWIWRTTIHPTYLRLAPGMVQIVEFGLGKRKPTIRSYPLTPGTVAMVNFGDKEGKPRSVTLARGEQMDEVPLWQMQRRADATERLWQALLSTAPTPPLSDEELVG